MKKDRFGRARVLSTAELDLLLEALPENHRVLATVLRRTAARVSEGLQLKWRYVMENQLLLTAPTTKGSARTRTVPIHGSESRIQRTIQINGSSLVVTLENISLGVVSITHYGKQPSRWDWWVSQLTRSAVLF